MKMQLILEKEAGFFWGRTLYRRNLIVDSATTIPILENKIRKALKNFYQLDDIIFEHQYDLTVFFEQFNFLNQTKVAALCGISPGLLRQYASGVKHPSKAQAAKIQSTIRQLASRLMFVKIYA